MDRRSLSVAILGSRGIPNRYGGFEACAEELALRLVEKGHRVTVYSVADHPMKDELWKGVRRVLIRDPEKALGSFGQFIYDFRSNLHSRKENFDIVLHLGYTSDSVWYWQWAAKSVHLVNMDGQEWKRAKYSKAVRIFLKKAEKLATLRASWLVADSREIKAYLERSYSVPVRYIAYGAYIPEGYSAGEVRAAGLEPGGYDLVLARMEPENNIEMAIEAKRAAGDGVPLVIVGNMNRYKKYLQRKYGSDSIIRFMDAVYDRSKVNALRHYSRLYVHGHSVGGTNPSLLEAMACSCRILAHDNPFNASVLGKQGRYYSSSEELTNFFINFKEEEFRDQITGNLQKIKEEYNWEAVTLAYEKLFYDALGTK